jgi:1,4-dihydroxy-2-naphthoate octaprenyltransferase
MGPVMVIGSYYVQTLTFTSEVLWISLSIGCTVTAILVANDLRDMEEDINVGKITLVTLFGRLFGRWEWTILVIAAFLIMVTLAATVSTPLILLSLLALIQVTRASKTIWRARERTELALALRATSRLHGELGFLLSVGVVLSRFITL